MDKVTSSYIFISSMMFMLFSVIGIIFDTWLVRTGRIPYSNKLIIIFFSLLLAFMKPFVLENLSWWSYSIIYLVILMTLNRSDWGESTRNGKWWWKKEKVKSVSKKREKLRKKSR